MLPMRSAAALISSAIALLAAALLLAGCGGSSASGSSSKIAAVGAENQYANVIEQIGGKYVSVSAIESNPNTDPHTFEASPSVAQAVSAAELLIENGVGYDTYMEKIESASPSSSRKVINVQQLLGLPDSHVQPPPLVQTRNDAGGRQGAGKRPLGPRIPPTRRTSRKTPNGSKNR